MGKATYSNGDVRACESPLCPYSVVYYGNQGLWMHIPKPTFRGVMTYHEPKPFPEHKHRLKLVDADDDNYNFECRVCTFNFSYNWWAVQKMLMGRYS